MKRKRVLWPLAAGLVVLAGIVGTLVTPWSMPCETQREEAAARWRQLASSLPPAERGRAQAVVTAIDGDLSAALERADALPPPADQHDLYRDAMERLALAESACRGPSELGD